MIAKTRIGILGEMGSRGMSYFYARCLERLQQTKNLLPDYELPQILVNNITCPQLSLPHVDAGSLQPYMKGLLELMALRPDFIVLACDTMNLFQKELVQATGFTNILSIADLVRQELSSHGVASPLCVLGNPATVLGKIFTYPEYKYIHSSYQELLDLQSIIQAYNTSGDQLLAKTKLWRLIAGKRKKGARTFLLACPEIADLLQDEEIETIDVHQVLIDAIANLCLEKRKPVGRLPRAVQVF